MLKPFASVRLQDKISSPPSVDGPWCHFVPRSWSCSLLSEATGLLLRPEFFFECPNAEAAIAGSCCRCLLAGRGPRPETAQPRQCQSPWPSPPCRTAAPAGRAAILPLHAACPGVRREELWELVAAGETAFSTAESERWGRDTFGDEDQEGDRVGGWIHEVDEFDAPFFGMNSAQAQAMDPQHRMLHEVAHEALERSNISVDAIAGTDAGVFVGVFAEDYRWLAATSNAGRSGRTTVSPYSGTGASAAGAAGLGTFFQNVRTSATIATACSSSLVAVHCLCCFAQ